MWRTLIVIAGEKITVRDDWIHVCSPQQEARVPIGDLYSVVVDNRQALLSMPALTQLAQAGVHVLLCDDKHLPCAELLPLTLHYRPLTVLQKQMALSQEFKDHLWQRIITAKIQNQAKALRLAGASGAKAQKLEDLSLHVLPGDSGNREAQAAKVYFPALFGLGFTRALEDVTNAALNYGYAILRSAVCKTLAGYGYSGILGLHHIGAGNPFNLADDLLEPLRPLVDLWTDNHCDDLFETLTRTNRRELIGLVNHVIRLDGKKMRVRYAIDRYVRSLTSAIEKQDAGLLLLPELIRDDPCLRMNWMDDRFMRLMVLFDLPVNTKKRRRDYAQFRKALIQDGFLMLQYSVYVRLARNHDDAQKHLRIVEDHLPPAGSVRAMLITEKQYTQMKLLCGEQMKDEHFLDTKDLLEI